MVEVYKYQDFGYARNAAARKIKAHNTSFQRSHGSPLGPSARTSLMDASAAAYLTLLPPPFAVQPGGRVHYLYDRRAAQSFSQPYLLQAHQHMRVAGSGGSRGSSARQLPALQAARELPALKARSRAESPMMWAENHILGTWAETLAELPASSSMGALPPAGKANRPVSSTQLEVRSESCWKTSWVRARAAAARAAAREQAAREAAKAAMEAKEAERVAAIKSAQEEAAERAAKLAARVKAARELAAKRAAEAAEKAADERRAAAAAAVLAAAAKAELRAAGADGDRDSREADYCDLDRRKRSSMMQQVGSVSRRSRECGGLPHAPPPHLESEWTAAKERAIAGTLKSVLTRWNAARQAVEVSAGAAGENESILAAAAALAEAESAADRAASQADAAARAREAAVAAMQAHEEAEARAAQAEAAERDANAAYAEAAARGVTLNAHAASLHARPSSAAVPPPLPPVAPSTAQSTTTSAFDGDHASASESLVEPAGEPTGSAAAAAASIKDAAAPRTDDRGMMKRPTSLWAKIRGFRSVPMIPLSVAAEKSVMALVMVSEPADAGDTSKAKGALNRRPSKAPPSFLMETVQCTTPAQAVAREVATAAIAAAAAAATCTTAEADHMQDGALEEGPLEAEALEAANEAARVAAAAREALAAATAARDQALARVAEEDRLAAKATAQAAAQRAAAAEARAILDARAAAERFARKLKKPPKKGKAAVTESTVPTSWEAVADLGLYGLLTRAEMRAPELKPDMAEVVNSAHLCVPDKKRRVASMLQEAIRLEAQQLEAEKLADAETVRPWQEWEAEAEFVVPSGDHHIGVVLTWY